MKTFILYRIWYGNLISYVGQTIQTLEQRTRQHFLYDCDLDLKATTKIEYAILNSQADLNVYEIYYMNKYKSFENRNGYAEDKLSIELPDLKWELFDEKVFQKIKNTKPNKTVTRSIPKHYNGDDRF